MNIKLYIMLLSLFLMNSYLYSEDIEFIEYELPTNNNIVEVEFFNTFSGIMVSESAEIFYTTNGGLNWNESEFKLDFTPKSLIFSGSGEAVIIGTKKTIIKSFDYGKSWLIMQYDKDSEVILNTIISKTPFEYFITQEGTRNIYYSVDGLQSVSITSLNGESGQYKTYPNILNKYDNYIYCAGNREFESSSNGIDYWNEGLNKTKYFHTIERLWYTSSIYSKYGSPPANIIESFVMIKNVILKFDGYRLKPQNGDNFGDGNFDIIYQNNNFTSQILSYNDNMFIIPDSKGQITYLTNVIVENSRVLKDSFIENKVQVSDTSLFDYYQIKDNKAITTTINGKYFMYDNSGSIDSLVIDTLGFNSIDTLVIDTIDQDSTDIIIKDPKDSTDYTNSNVIIYPNPTSDYFTIEFQVKNNVESIQVFDVKGYRELNFVLNKELVEYKIDLCELQRGTYFIKIITSSGVFHKKIIKF